MSADYTPTPAQQTEFTQTSDGDDKDATSVDTFLQGLADAIAASPMLPFNWSSSGTTNHNLKRGQYSKRDQAWFGVGNGGTDFLEASFSSGRVWISQTIATGLPLLDVAFDRAGNGVVLAQGGSGTVAKGVWNSYGLITWTAHVAVLAANVSDGRIVYDPIHSNWIAVYRNGALGMHVDTSPDGLVWTSRTIPSAWTGYTGTQATPKIYTDGAGTVIAVFNSGDAGVASYHVIRSTDGGATWTDIGPIAGIASNLAVADLAYDSVYNVWFFAASVTGTRRSELYKSTDGGASWTAAAITASLAVAGDVALRDIVSLCGVLVGINDDGRIFFSTDHGTTLFLATTNPIVASADPGLDVGDGQLIVFNPADKTTFASLRHGAVGTQVV